MLSDFPGITSVIPHLVAVFLLWLLALAIIWAVKYNLLKNTEDINADRESILKYSRIARTIVTSIALLAALVFILFFSSLFERNYEGINRITPTEVPETFTPPSKEEIQSSNKTAISKKANEKRKEATEDNAKAMKKLKSCSSNPSA